MLALRLPFSVSASVGSDVCLNRSLYIRSVAPRFAWIYWPAAPPACFSDFSEAVNVSIDSKNSPMEPMENPPPHLIRSEASLNLVWLGPKITGML